LALLVVLATLRVVGDMAVLLILETTAIVVVVKAVAVQAVWDKTVQQTPVLPVQLILAVEVEVAVELIQMVAGLAVRVALV
jgi:anti-sigma factor RsiW